MRFWNDRRLGRMILAGAVLAGAPLGSGAEEAPRLEGVQESPRLLAQDAGTGFARSMPGVPADPTADPPARFRLAEPDATAQGAAGPGEAMADDGTDSAEAKPIADSAIPAPAASDEEPLLEPIPDAEHGGPVDVQAASFMGATPGATTRDALEENWGSPTGEHEQGGVVNYTYEIEPFELVEATIYQETLVSIVIRLQRSFPAETVARQLDLANIRPVFVANELGEILGQAFPERGVLFAFEPSSAGERPTMLVAQIILEPITPEPFLLRAETHLESLPQESLRDLDQVLQLQPQHARAHWLQARALSAVGRLEKAIAAGARAVEFDEGNPRFRITHAELLKGSGRHEQAVAEVQEALARSESIPHVKARALCLEGELAILAAPRDYRRALEQFTAAIQFVDPLVADPHPAIATAAKEVLLDAHLGAAGAIAWGPWQRKDEAVPQWLERAEVVAENLTQAAPGGEVYRFRLGVRALAACVGMEGRLDPTPWVEVTRQSGSALIEQAAAPERKRQIDWQLGMALYDAVQIHQMRGEHDLALRYGEQAIEHLEAGGDEKGAPRQDYLLGRLYFRLGAIHALAEENHRAAITWFDKAIPRLEKPLPPDATADLGRHGETFVSMAVSYWETGQQQLAVTLTERGAALMEEAVRLGALEEQALAVPFGNLATMHDHLGQEASAKEFAEMAGRIGTTPR